MQFLYRFASDLSTAEGRLAYSLLPYLKQILPCSLKAETSLQPGSAWQDFYPLFSTVPQSPQVVWHHLPGSKWSPLQGHIVMANADSALLQQADDIWYWQGSKHANETNDNGFGLPLACGLLPEASALPLEIQASHVWLVVSHQLETPALEDALKAYLQHFGTATDTTLFLHLDCEDEQAEQRLLDKVLALCETLDLDPDQINLETWIGPLEGAAWHGLLLRSVALIETGNPLLESEARSVGCPVVAHTDLGQPLSERVLVSATESLEHLAQCIAARLEDLFHRIDFAERRKQYEASQHAVRQGRKQKYSLFHSDYKSEELQARRQWHLRYAQQFQGVPGDVLDIGCGSALFLEIMRDLALPAFGLDPDPDMVAVCQELGLIALLGDERALADYPPESLGGIHASHVIEHIDGDRAIAMVENAYQALRPGGLFLIRTPNWRNQQVRHEGFWLDITHIRPYPLPLLQQVLKDAGFEVITQGFEDFGWNDTFITGRKGVLS